MNGDLLDAVLRWAAIGYAGTIVLNLLRDAGVCRECSVVTEAVRTLRTTACPSCERVAGLLW